MKFWRIREWQVWSLPRQVIGPVLTVELAALGLVISLLVDGESFRLMDITILVLIVFLATAHTEISVGIERLRRRITPVDHFDFTSVWVFAGAILLPPVVAAIITVVIHTHLWWRAWRPRVPLYRQMFTVSTAVLACLAASASMRHVSDGGIAEELGGGMSLLAIVVGLLVFTTVNSALVAGAIAVSTAEISPADLIGDWDENILEVSTLSLGALAAVSMAVNPWLVVFILPPLMVLHRAVLVRDLETAANIDSKTGLLNAGAWHSQAERELQRAERREGPRAVLVIDLDHFKNVNDTHGHLAGDHVLAAVADSLRDEVRDRDLVGRFGGEEFVVMLGGLDGPGRGGQELDAVAERIRRRVAALRVEIATADGPLTVAGLSVSVGGALYPGDGRELRALLQVADAALYAAKRAGRNRVRVGLVAPVDDPSSLPAPDRS